jgi:hypothetical protein
VNLGSTNSAEGVNSKFVPLREKTDRTGLELRKSLQCKALRNSSAESIVTKRVALGEPFKSSEFPSVRFNGEAEGNCSRLFSLFSEGFRDSRPARRRPENALISRQNRISQTGPRKFVCNSQILCLTEKSCLTTGLRLIVQYMALEHPALSLAHNLNALR